MTTWIAFAQLALFTILLAAGVFVGLVLGWRARFWMIRFQANEHAYETRTKAEGSPRPDLEARIRALSEPSPYTGSHPAGPPLQGPDEFVATQEAERLSRTKEKAWAQQG